MSLPSPFLPTSFSLMLTVCCVAVAQEPVPQAVFVPALGVDVIQRADRVQVVRIVEQGPAVDILQRGDVLVEVNQSAIRSIAQLRVVLADLRDGERTVVKVARDDLVRPLAFQIGQRPNVVIADAQVPPPLVVPPTGPGTVQLNTAPPLPEAARSVRDAVEPTILFCMAVRDFLPGGVLVLDVMGESPAAKAGIQSGDIIVGVGQARTNTLAQMNAAIQSFKRGDTAVLHVVRDGQSLDVAVSMEPCEYSAAKVTNLEDTRRQIDRMRLQIFQLQRTLDVLHYSIRRATP